jgi:diguanylate cyclase (GGDEF)-like protein/PAS domain S-box-containing protein
MNDPPKRTPPAEEVATRAPELLSAAVLDSLKAHVAVLDGQGVIVLVNAAWRQFAARNDGREDQVGVGANYLAVCRRAIARNHDPLARAALDGIRAVLDGARADFSLEYPFPAPHSTEDPAWFLMHVAPLDGARQGVVVVHENITERKQTDEWLKLTDARYRAIIESQHDLVCRFLPDGTLTFINQAYCRFFGRTYEELLGSNFMLLVPEADRACVAALVTACNTDHPINFTEHPVLRADGETRVIQWTDLAILDEGDALIEMQSIGRDVTEQRQIEAALRDSEARYRRIVETAQEGILMLDAENRATFANARLAEILGCTLEDFMATSIFEFMDEEWRRIAVEHIGRRRQGIAEQHDFKFRRPDGEEVWALLSTNPILDGEGQYAGALAMVADITKRKHLEQELERLATLDPLTGLFNRRHFLAVATREFERSQRYRRPLAALMLDLDHFKRINDTYGHAAGDQVLQTAVDTLRVGLRQVDLSGRYGGEEFAVMLPETEPTTAQVVAERLCAAMATQPIAIDKDRVSVTVSIGVAALTDVRGATLEQLLDRADQALYAAKQAGRNQVKIWAPNGSAPSRSMP